jgi:hypothetical protein
MWPSSESRRDKEGCRRSRDVCTRVGRIGEECVGSGGLPDNGGDSRLLRTSSGIVSIAIAARRACALTRSSKRRAVTCQGKRGVRPGRLPRRCLSHVKGSACSRTPWTMGSRPAFHFATVRIGLPAFGSVLRVFERKAYLRRNWSAVITAFFNV